MQVARPARDREAPRKRAAPFRCRLVIMAKEPVAGRVKSRLAREIGVVAATRFYRGCSGAVIARLAADRRWTTELAVAPDCAVASRAWPRHVQRRPQQGGGLGQRMQRILDHAPPGPVIVIGTDIPAVAPRHLADAFRRLKRADAVVGPAPDGGYWLLGLRRSPRILRPFQAVRWSSSDALADTIRNLAGHGIERAAMLADVDDGAGWRRCRGWSSRRILPL